MSPRLHRYGATRRCRYEWMVTWPHGYAAVWLYAYTSHMADVSTIFSLLPWWMPEGHFMSYRCWMRYANESLPRVHRPGSAPSEVTRYEHDMSSLLLKCTLGNFGAVWACIHSCHLVREPTSTAETSKNKTHCRFYQFCGSPCYTLAYSASISIISTAGMV